MIKGSTSQIATERWISKAKPPAAEGGVAPKGYISFAELCLGRAEATPAA